MDGTDRGGELEQKARELADGLTAIARTVAPSCAPFTARYVDNRVAITQGDPDGITLHASNQPVLALKVSMSCEWDLERKFLAVHSSKIEVLASVSREPLFRFEYVRGANSVPAAHLQVHAHRDAMTYVMTTVGRTSKRPGRSAKTDGLPKLQDLHFPLGGHRFRPALEDVVEMLIDEFNLDHELDAREVLAEQRETWRLTQTKAAVRDAPEAAIEALTSMGYSISPPEDTPPPRHHGRLRAL